MENGFLKRVTILKSIFILLMIFLSSNMLLSADISATSYVVKSIQIEEGLPQNTVFSVLQTSDGYVWAGTDEGLVRFDGLRFKLFDTLNTPQMRGNSIRALYQDRSGNLWIGGKGLTKYRDGKFVDFSEAGGVALTNVRAIYEDSLGTLWIGTYGGGVVRINGEKTTLFTEKEGLNDNLVFTILEDSYGAIWIGTNRGLCLLRTRNAHASRPRRGSEET